MIPIYLVTLSGLLFHELVLCPHNPHLHLKGSGKEPPSLATMVMSLMAQSSKPSLQQLFAAGLRVDGVDVCGKEALREE